MHSEKIVFLWISHTYIHTHTHEYIYTQGLLFMLGFSNHLFDKRKTNKVPRGEGGGGDEYNRRNRQMQKPSSLFGHLGREMKSIVWRASTKSTGVVPTRWVLVISWKNSLQALSFTWRLNRFRLNSNRIVKQWKSTLCRSLNKLSIYI